MSAKCHRQTSRPNRPSLTAWSSTAESFEDEAIDDAANRALLCEVGTDQAVRGLAPCITISRTALSALHTAGLPTGLFGVVLSCPGAAIKMGNTVMSVIDQALKANELYAKTYDPKWGAGPPKPKLAVVTCMDPRLSDLPGILGLKHADIDVIRTGGPAVTEDVLAELIVSTTSTPAVCER